MLQKLIPILIFAAVAISIIQLVNYSFAKTYTTVEQTVKMPYARAQAIYETEVTAANY